MAKFLLDTAEIEKIKQWLPYIDGITTNPILFEKAGTTAMELYGKIAKLVLKQDFKMFIQVANKPVHDHLLSPSARAMEVIYKVPLVPQEHEFISKLRHIHNLRTCGTMTYDIIQLQTAINLGVDYCIVLCHKNKDYEFPWEAATLRDNIKSDVKLIGASFRTKQEVTSAIIDGMDYVTVPPRVMEECFYNEQAKEDYEKIYS